MVTTVSATTGLKLQYSTREAIWYCTDNVSVVGLLALSTDIKPKDPIRVPCLYKNGTGNWYMGMVMLSGSGKFTVLYYPTYPCNSAASAESGYVLFTMCYAR